MLSHVYCICRAYNATLSVALVLNKFTSTYCLVLLVFLYFVDIHTFGKRIDDFCFYSGLEMSLKSAIGKALYLYMTYLPIRPDVTVCEADHVADINN